LPGGFAVPLLAIAAMAAILTTLTGKEWRAIGIALAVLVVVYALLRLRRRGS
jgi:APA family basic amino acid/polyamine antiporter